MTTLKDDPITLGSNIEQVNNVNDAKKTIIKEDGIYETTLKKYISTQRAKHCAYETHEW